MKILILTGSARVKGTSALLAERFTEGAVMAGHTVKRMDCALLNLRDCTGCGRCQETGTCVFRDAMDRIGPAVREADLIAFVTPLYYYSMTAQLKSAIDRLYALDGVIHGTKKSVLLMTCTDTDPHAPDALVAQWEKILGYLEWENAGTLLALGVPERADIEASDYPAAARAFGASL